MPTATITVGLNDKDSLWFKVSSQSTPDTVSITGTGAGTRIVLTPASSDDATFDLTLNPGAGIARLDSLTTPVYAGGPIRSTEGRLVVTCDDQPIFYGSAVKAQVGYTPASSNQQLVSGDPTIVFNPPSGIGADQLEAAPVAAEPVMV
jgi:hypothetical protein